MMNDVPEIALNDTRIIVFIVFGYAGGEGKGEGSRATCEISNAYVSKTVGYAKLAKSTTLYRLVLV